MRVKYSRDDRDIIDLYWTNATRALFGEPLLEYSRKYFSLALAPAYPTLLYRRPDERGILCDDLAARTRSYLLR